MRELFRKIKDMLNKPGLSQPDFWIFVAMGLMLIAVITDKMGFALIAPLPTLVAGFYLAWSEAPDDGDDGDEDEFDDLDPDDARLKYDLRA